MSRAADELANDTIVGIVSQDGAGRRVFNFLIGLAIALAGLAVAVVALKPYIIPPTLAERAASIVQLRFGATVEKVVEAKRRGDGDVWFTLKEPAGYEGTSLQSIWMTSGHSYSWSASSVAVRPAPPRVRTPAGSASSPTGTAKAKPGKAKASTPKVAKAATPAWPTILRDGETYLEFDKATKRYHFHVVQPE